MLVVRRVESMTGPIWHFPEAVVGFRDEGGEVLRVFAVDGRSLPERLEVRLRENVETVLDLAVPSPLTIVDRLCGLAEEDEVGLLLGHVRNPAPDTTLVSDAAVRIVWVAEGASPRTRCHSPQYRRRLARVCCTWWMLK
jgi:hypothetical protein